MRTLTLSGSVLAPQSPLPPCFKRSKPFNSFPQCPNSCSKKHNSKLSCGNHRSVLSRRSRCSSANTYEEWVQHFLQANSANLNGIDFRSFGCKHCKATADSFNNLDDHDALYKSSEKDNSENENDFATIIQKSEKSVDGLMKFALLLGLFMIQGSEQAIAGSDFAGGLQSTSFLGDLGDISTSFASAFLLIFFSELGDKTFFIAALLAARNSAAAVFTGTFGALAGMTIISVGLGRTFHYVDELLPFRFGETDLPIDDIAAVFLLVYFGASTLLDVTSSDGLKTEDEKKEAELAVSEISGNGAGILAAANTVISTFLLVFVAEWGDKSFFSTIALAAASSPLGVIGGALAGHGIATLLAVLGGSLLGTFLSEKVIAYIGGVLFLVFAVVTLLGIIT